MLTIDLLALQRVPLRVSKEIPQGQLQPYAFAGPGFFIANTNDDETDTNIGLVTGGGLRWMLNSSAGFLAEYRFTRFSPELEFDSSATRIRLEGDLNTHSVVVGFTINF